MNRQRAHLLKTANPYFTDVVKGDKNFEVRSPDRDFRVGDVLILQEYIAGDKVYTGNEIAVKVKYLLNLGIPMFDADYVVMGFDGFESNVVVEEKDTGKKGRLVNPAAVNAVVGAEKDSFTQVQFFAITVGSSVFVEPLSEPVDIGCSKLVFKGMYVLKSPYEIVSS